MKNKWVEAAPHEPLTVAARRALRSRLNLVADALPVAARSDVLDPEAIHQLRVSTRRAWAALDCYDQVLPQRAGQWIRKQLKRIRKVAGGARDLDVLGLRLRSEAGAQRAQCHALLVHVEELGRRARKPVAELWALLKEKRFRQRIRKLVNGVGWQGDCLDEPAFADAARQRMRELAGRFFAAATGNLRDTRLLHEFRILGKRLRYAMELNHAAFGPEFRDVLYVQLEEIQERIGATIDHAAAIERFEMWLAKWDDPQLVVPLQRLLAGEQAALATSRDTFARWWSEERTKQFERQFHETLKQPLVERVA